MIRPFSLFLGLRYVRSRRRNGFISFIAASSLLGIALGVTALITVLSVMNGFERELRGRILDMTAHATVQGLGGPLENWPSVREKALLHPEVLAAAPYIEEQGLLVVPGHSTGVLLRGVDPELEPSVSEMGEKLITGDWSVLNQERFNILLGADLASSLGVSVGDSVQLVVPRADASVLGVQPRMRQFHVQGLFRAGMYEYDSAMAIAHHQDLAALFRYGEAVSGVRLKVVDVDRAAAVAREIAYSLPEGARISDWTRNHRNLFTAIQMEKTVMFVILALIIAVAAFNIVSTMVMVVTDKRADIAILRTLGATPGVIQRIFLVQGIWIGLFGTLLGAIGGVALALNVETIVPWLEQLFNVQFLSADIYYITELPSDLRIADVLKICGLSFVLTILATIYPARRGARTEPAEALRYE
ncbi:MAG: lipoprotein-releasing ABC transporter permease subunit [Gammaproteobacteria bacterium]